MTLPTHELELAIAWLTHAAPERTQWSGPSADSCRHQIEQLVHQIRALLG